MVHMGEPPFFAVVITHKDMRNPLLLHPLKSCEITVRLSMNPCESSDAVHESPADDHRLDRRDLLNLGAAALGGPAPAETFPPRAAAAPTAQTAVIQLFLSGGPSQLDTFDPKPDAPASVRGPYRPINTRLRGVVVSELFPLLAQQMDRFVLL